MVTRLDEREFNPEKLPRTLANLRITKSFLELAKQQMEKDRAMIDKNSSSNMRTLASKSLCYFALLNQWVQTTVMELEKPFQEVEEATLHLHRCLNQQCKCCRPPTEITTTHYCRRPAIGNETRSADYCLSCTQDFHTAGGRICCTVGCSNLVLDTKHCSLHLGGQPRPPIRALLDRTAGILLLHKRQIFPSLFGTVDLYDEAQFVDVNIMETFHDVRFTDMEYAVKRCDKTCVMEGRRLEPPYHAVADDFFMELDIQRFLSEYQDDMDDHFIVPLWQSLMTPFSYYSLTTYINGGELWSWIAHQGKPCPDWFARDLFLGLVDCVFFLHDHNVVHRDVSLENFLLGGQDNLEPMLIDFGVAMRTGDDGMVRYPSGRNPLPGKFRYYSPELIRPNIVEYDAKAADVWALGVCWLIMLCYGIPWEPTPDAHRSPLSSMEKHPGWIQVVNHRNPHQFFQNKGIDVSIETCELLARIFDPDPQTRIKIDQLYVEIGKLSSSGRDMI